MECLFGLPRGRENPKVFTDFQGDKGRLSSVTPSGPGTPLSPSPISCSGTWVVGSDQKTTVRGGRVSSHFPPGTERSVLLYHPSPTVDGQEGKVRRPPSLPPGPCTKTREGGRREEEGRPRGLGSRVVAGLKVCLLSWCRRGGGIREFIC